MLITSGVFTLYVIVGPLAGSINFCLFFSSIGCTVLSFSSSGLRLDLPDMLYYCKRMPCTGSLFEIIVVTILVLGIGLVLELCKSLLSR